MQHCHERACYIAITCVSVAVVMGVVALVLVQNGTGDELAHEENPRSLIQGAKVYIAIPYRKAPHLHVQAERENASSENHAPDHGGAHESSAEPFTPAKESLVYLEAIPLSEMKDGALGEAYATILTEDNIQYFQMAIVLTWSLLRIDPDRAVIIAYGKGLNYAGIAMLRALYAIAEGRVYLVEVDLVPLPKGHWLKPKDYRYSHVSTKLLFFDMTAWTRIAFIDADHLVQASPVAIFDCDRALCATCDFGSNMNVRFRTPGLNCGYLNGGLLVLQPSHGLFTGIMKRYYAGNWYDSGLPDQEFLSQFFKHQWRELDIKYNKFFDDRRENNDIVLVHTKALKARLLPKQFSVWKESVKDLLSVLRGYEDVPEQMLELDFWKIGEHTALRNIPFAGGGGGLHHHPLPRRAQIPRVLQHNPLMSKHQPERRRFGRVAG